MPKINWDKPGTRRYESGLDRGVLYLPTGDGVAWNGLTSVDEIEDRESSPTFFDGRKINDFITLGSFSANLKAVTYPDEFVELEGFSKLRRGVFLGDQMPKHFGLTYRTMIGNDLKGDQAGYKLHIWFNLVAIPDNKTRLSSGGDPNLVEFGWTISGVPVDIPGFRPTAHIVVDSRYVDRRLLKELEDKLYGSETNMAKMPTMSELVSWLEDWAWVKVYDNGDGTWTAASDTPGFIVMSEEEDGLFEINGITAYYIDGTTFIISDTEDTYDVPLMAVYDNGDGTWTASSDYDELIVIVDEEEGLFELRNVELEFEGPDLYRIRDTDT